MAHKKGLGSSKNGRDSQGQHRGIKCYDGERVKSGSIIVRQCGTKFFPGLNTAMGRDFTIFAKKDGLVRFANRRVINVISPN